MKYKAERAQDLVWRANALQAPKWSRQAARGSGSSSRRRRSRYCRRDKGKKNQITGTTRCSSGQGKMVDFFQSQLMAFGSFTALFSVLSRLKGGAAPNHAETGQSSSTLTYRYLTVYALLMASDWLQGPFMHVSRSFRRAEGADLKAKRYHLLASEHHFAPSQISMLFVIGFAMAGISSPWIGRLADV